MARHKYTEEEIKMILDPTISNDELSKKIGVTKGSITAKRSRLHVAKNRNCNLFVDGEKEAILSGKYTAEELATMFNNTLYCMRNKIINLTASNPSVRHVSKFSNDEIELLKENKGVSYTAKKLNRPKTAITNKRFTLKITNKKKEKWTDEEYDIVRANNSLNAKKLSKLLPNRSANSIDRVKEGLGLTKDRIRFSDDELEYLQNNLSKPINELAKALNRPIISVKQKVEKLLSSFCREIEPWSAEEDIDIISGMKVSCLSKKYKRSPSRFFRRRCELAQEVLRRNPKIIHSWAIQFSEEENNIIFDKNLTILEAAQKLSVSSEFVRRKRYLNNKGIQMDYTFVYNVDDVLIILDFTIPAKELSKIFNKTPDTILSARKRYIQLLLFGEY